MTDLAGFSTSFVRVVLGIYGADMVSGMVVSGRVASLGIMRGVVFALALIALMLAVSGLLVHLRPLAIVMVFVLGFLPSILVPILQTRLMDVAHEGQSLAAALNHSTLDIANALGAWLGSIVLQPGSATSGPAGGCPARRARRRSRSGPRRAAATPSQLRLRRRRARTVDP